MHLKSLFFSALISLACRTQAQTPAAAPATATALTPSVAKICSDLGKKFTEYRWGDVKCDQYKWNHVRNSNLGTPLLWTVFGEESSPASANTTLVLCGVHGDEITPVKFCWDLLQELKAGHSFKDKVVVVAPLVSPDSFLKVAPSRTNGRGVDVNRNFPTKDWHGNALNRWRDTYKKDKRKFPGHSPGSEQETVFQMNLIKRYRPNKVITVHAPLTMLDYDGPSLKAESGKTAKILLEQMSQKSSGYKISNYPIFPGSLGNWAGKENHIPTYTLELPNSNNFETDKFWALFKESVIFAIENKMKPPVD
ncbi:MAG TPA: M14 family zinc carboxypeptidase [Bacteriovoracaceae bacterium]|nr:M14 family zinc carboxypeptidase [Bacteriovoracaceae bacterium]